MGQTYPLPISKAMVTPAYVPVIPFYSGRVAVYPNEGSATTTDLNQTPRYQTEKLALWSKAPAYIDEAMDITKPLGPVGPKDAYPTTPPAAPTAVSLSPDTGVHGGADIIMTVTGTGFTPFTSIIWNGMREYTDYISPTQVSTVVRLSTASGAAAIPVSVVDHGVVATPNLTFTIT